MSLNDVKIKEDCVILNNNVQDEKTKIRLMELGLIEGCLVKVERKSIFKKTLLISFASSCFTLKENLAKHIEVKYA